MKQSLLDRKHVTKNNVQADDQNRLKTKYDFISIREGYLGIRLSAFDF